jgi:hypothetical protein
VENKLINFPFEMFIFNEKVREAGVTHDFGKDCTHATKETAQGIVICR